MSVIVLSAYPLDDRKYPWLRIVISVSSNSKIDLVLIRIAAVSCHEAEERILGRLRNGLSREGRLYPVDRHVCGDLMETLLG